MALPATSWVGGLEIGGGGREQDTRNRTGGVRPQSKIGPLCSCCHIPVSQGKIVRTTWPATSCGGGLDSGGEVQTGAAFSSALERTLSVVSCSEEFSACCMLILLTELMLEYACDLMARARHGHRSV